MSPSPPESSREEPYKYDESFIQSQNEDRVQLPQDDNEVFSEVQTFDQSWVWILLGIGVLLVFIPLLVTGQPWWLFLLMAIVQVLSMSMMASFKLNTRIDEIGIHYQFKPLHWKERIIPWGDIDQIYVRQYSPIAEYGGRGMRYGLKGLSYNINGNQGIQIIRKNGKRLLIGTQKPDEASRQIDHHLITV